MRVFLLCAIVLGLAPCVQGQTPIYIVPQDGTVDTCMDSTYCAEVWIGAATDIKGYSVEMIYRPDHMALISVQSGDIFSLAGHSSAFFDDLRPGAVYDTVAVDASDLTGTVSGPGHLFTLCFGPPWGCGAVTPLAFVMAIVRDSDNMPISVSTADGTVTIECPTAVDASTWGSIKALYR
ncbi:MAG: hypothetical protein PVJ42_09970 [bacterium]